MAKRVVGELLYGSVLDLRLLPVYFFDHFRSCTMCFPSISRLFCFPHFPDVLSSTAVGQRLVML